MIYLDGYISPLGELTMAGDGENLTMLSFTGQGCLGAGVFDWKGRKEIPVFEEVKEWLTIYFSGKEPDFMPKLSLRGSAFQMEIWELLRKIPYGQVVSYGEVAEEIARKRGMKKVTVQSVGAAVGRNPISILVPSHRVVGKDGKSVGYYGGTWRKEELLRIEAKGELR